MANNKKFVVKNGLQAQNISFADSDQNNTILARMLPTDVLTFDGTSGSLLTLADDSKYSVQVPGGLQADSVEATNFVGDLTGTADDADLLGGNDSSFYRNASNLNAGTISDDRLPATISSDITGNAATATNADQLDGQDGSYYQNADNLNAGTISDDRLPNSISSDITGNAATADSADNAAYAVQAGNADQLDGQEGSFYQNASNLNAGTISDDRLPNSISSDITGNAATADSADTAAYAVQAGNADTVDGLQANQFLRSDADDTTTGKVTISNSGTIGGSNLSNGYLQITDGSHTLAFDTNEIIGSTNVNIGSTSGAGAVNLKYGNANKISTTNTGVDVTGLTTTDDLEVSDSARIAGNLIVGGNFTVAGTTTTINTETINLADNNIVLNSNHTGSPSQNAGITVNRGTSSDAIFQWNETNDYWEFGARDVFFQGSGTNARWDTSQNRMWFPDGSKVTFGDGADLEISHDGSNSIIQENGAGDLRIRAQNLALQDNDGTNFLYGTFNGSVTLYHNNNQKLETTSTGIDITGQVVGDSATFTNVSATFSGNGSSITNLDADNIATGTIDDARLPNSISSDITGNAATADSADNAAFAVFAAQAGAAQTADSAVNASYAVQAGNADTLDGQQGSYYRNASNLNAGTISDDRLPNSISSDITGTAANAELLDNLNSTQFLRSDAADTKTSGDLGFSDNVKATFGASQDLEVYHDGSNSYVKDTGTGELRLSSNIIHGRNAADNETLFKATENGSVELYHNNVKKLQTTEDGVDITSTGSFRLPVGTDLQRPTGQEGDIRWNSERSQAEAFDGDVWAALAGGSGISDKKAIAYSILYGRLGL